jgi:predicted DsbA family dithiol-disulfide isomerase
MDGKSRGQEMSTLSTTVLGIDIVSDVVCPWCYVGKRQLEQALSGWKAANPGLPAPTLRWRPFQLNPGMPAAGMPRSADHEQKFGAGEGGGRYGRVLAAARQVGLELRLDAIRVQPNTLKAHGLVELAAESGDQSAAVEAFFRAYFLEGRDLSDDAVLREIALGVGMAETLVDAVLAEEAVVRIVAAADAELREYGVTGVPLFLVGNALGEHVAVSGAQGAQALLQAMRQAATA